MQVGNYGLNPLWAGKEVLSWKEPRLCSLAAWDHIRALSPAVFSSVQITNSTTLSNCCENLVPHYL